MIDTFQEVLLQKIIIIHDEESQCMMPDLKITLVFDVVKDDKQKSEFIALCRLFFSRLVDFACMHPEVVSFAEYHKTLLYLDVTLLI